MKESKEALIVSGRCISTARILSTSSCMPQRRSTQKSTLSGASLPFRPGSRAELCEHGLADLVHVADDAVGAVVEDRRLGIGVHGDDHVRV